MVSDKSLGYWIKPSKIERVPVRFSLSESLTFNLDKDYSGKKPTTIAYRVRFRGTYKGYVLLVGKDHNYVGHFQLFNAVGSQQFLRLLPLITFNCKDFLRDAGMPEIGVGEEGWPDVVK